MAYKTILVHLDAGKGAEACTEAAFSLAQKFDAHVVGLHALTVVPPPTWAMAEAGVAVESARNKALAEIAARVIMVMSVAHRLLSLKTAATSASGYWEQARESR